MKTLVLIAAIFAFNAHAQSVPASCMGAPPANESIFNQTWHMEFSQNGIDFQMAIQFTPTSATLTNTCKLPDGNTLQVAVTAPANVGSSQVQILQAVQNETDSGSDTCTASLSASSFTYSFAGSCLEMNSNGQIGYLTP